MAEEVYWVFVYHIDSESQRRRGTTIGGSHYGYYYYGLDLGPWKADYRTEVPYRVVGQARRWDSHGSLDRVVGPVEAS